MYVNEMFKNTEKCGLCINSVQQIYVEKYQIFRNSFTYNLKKKSNKKINFHIKKRMNLNFHYIEHYYYN